MGVELLNVTSNWELSFTRLVIHHGKLLKILMTADTDISENKVCQLVWDEGTYSLY